MGLVSSSYKRFWSAWPVVLASACAGDLDPPTLATQAVDMQSALDAVQAELEAHSGHVQRTREPDDVVDLERRHMEAMVTALHGLREAQHGIALCGQHMSIAHHRHELDPLVEQNAKLAASIEEAYGEVGRHWRAIAEAAVLQGMLDEEHEYGRVMAGFLSDMRAGRDAMKVTLATSRKGGSMECPVYTNGDAR
jgi:hypothetical protein